MTPADAWDTIDDLDALTEVIGMPMPRTRDKARPALLPVDRDWLAASPFCILATTGADGSCDASPKGDPAGQLVHVLDDRTIAITERPGNRRADGYRNILGNPQVGMIFLIPGRGDTLRINGRARLVRDAPFFDEMVVKGHRPLLAIVVDIDEIFTTARRPSCDRGSGTRRPGIRKARCHAARSSRSSASDPTTRSKNWMPTTRCRTTRRASTPEASPVARPGRKERPVDRLSRQADR